LLVRRQEQVRSTRSMPGRRWRYGTAAVAVLTLGVASACSSSSSSTPAAPGSSASAATTPAATGSASSGTLSFPRTETLYTSGTAYGPPVNWNPLDTGAFATGTQGLIYEPLYLYDPVKGKYDPWLATGDEAADELDRSLRDGKSRTPANPPACGGIRHIWEKLRAS